MLFGVAFYSFIIGIIGAFFRTNITRNSLLTKRLKKLEVFSKQMKISKALNEEIVKAIEYSAKKIVYLW